MPTVLVIHSGYGCESGCCGHSVEVDGKKVGKFDFGHPRNSTPEALLEYARDLVTEQYGAEHVKDIDWDKSIIVDD